MSNRSSLNFIVDSLLNIADDRLRIKASFVLYGMMVTGFFVDEVLTIFLFELQLFQLIGWILSKNDRTKLLSGRPFTLSQLTNLISKSLENLFFNDDDDDVDVYLPANLTLPFIEFE
ncbi:hypothetical protein DERP_000846 [Dermatophagoides pteronyssinus]|uniref:Uncharacterized protein n=1 Tax=Dermatophagoides pteronyssinus TaxID=6956 RepID=A0ABQ8J1A6_DERPT|nr:hypothetical protein DERP_000846 [Dermatophagoides pteronyssinus]